MADSAVAIVDRDGPFPVIAVSGIDGASSDGDGKRDRPKSAVPDAKLKGKLLDAAGASFRESGHSLQDRLFSKFVSYHHNVTVQDEAPVQEVAG